MALRTIIPDCVSPHNFPKMVHDEIGRKMLRYGTKGVSPGAGLLCERVDEAKAWRSANLVAKQRLKGEDETILKRQLGGVAVRSTK